MSIISSVANYGGKINDNQQYIKQFIESPNQNSGIVYSKVDGKNIQSLGSTNIPVLIKGDLIVNGSIYNPSDLRLKNNINELDENDLFKLNDLKTVKFNYNNDKNNKLHYGLIADEVENIFPELVENSPAGFKILNYNELLPILIRKMQVMDLQIQNLKEEIIKISNKN